MRALEVRKHGPVVEFGSVFEADPKPPVSMFEGDGARAGTYRVPVICVDPLHVNKFRYLIFRSGMSPNENYRMLVWDDACTKSWTCDLSFFEVAELAAKLHDRVELQDTFD